MELQYFLELWQLFLIWLQWYLEKVIVLFFIILILLFLFKLFSVMLIWVKGVKGFGGVIWVILSMFLEMFFLVLLVLVCMFFYICFVLVVFFGWLVQWNLLQCDDDVMFWSEVICWYGMQILLGIVWILLVVWFNLCFLWWLLLIVGLLILLILVLVIFSWVKLGLCVCDEKLFLILEEYDMLCELCVIDEYIYENCWYVFKDGFFKVVVDLLFNVLVCVMGMVCYNCV